MGKQKENHQRWDEVDGVKEEAGSKGRVRIIVESDQ